MKLNRLKTNYNVIEKVTADLPEEHEQTLEPEAVSAAENTESEIDIEENKRPESFNLSDSKVVEKAEPLQIKDNSSKACSPSGSTAVDSSKIFQATPAPKVDESSQIQSE